MKRTIKTVFYKIKYRKNHLRIGRRAAIGGLHSRFEGENSIGENTRFQGEMGFASYIRRNCNLINVSVGRFCSIGDNVSVALGKHPADTFVSTHPAFYSKANEATCSFVKENKFTEHDFAEQTPFSAVIGNDVWIGNGVQIREGVRIGDGAIIAMGAVVTDDVEPFAVMGGVPARLIRYRFGEEERANLLKTAWWDRDIAWIREHADTFADIHAFLQWIGEAGDRI